MGFRVIGCRGAIAAAIAATGLAHAQSLTQDINAFATDTGQYNLVVFGGATLNGSSDTQGGIAVEGNLAIGGSWTLASQVAAGSNPSLYLGGSLSLSGTTYLNNGYASTPALKSAQWTWNSSQKQLSSGSQVLGINSSGAYTTTNPITNPAPASWTWSTAQSGLRSASTALGNATATGTISVSGQSLLFTAPSGQTSGVVVFNLCASSLSGGVYDGQTFTNVQVNVPAGLNYVINVVNIASGETFFGSGVNVNAGLNDNQLLWNFEGSATFTIGGGGSFYGSILAPQSAITDNASINGQVAAATFVDNGVELHDTNFTPIQGLVPESFAFAWWAAGLCGAAVIFRRLSRRLSTSLRSHRGRLQH